MPAGDLIFSPYQYEFNNLLFGSRTDFRTTKVEGILGLPGVLDQDIPRIADHGSYPGMLTLSKRTIAFDLTILGDPGDDIEQKLAVAKRAFQPPRRRKSNILVPFVFSRPGEPRKMCMVRCTKREFTSEYSTARGRAEGSVELQAPDPRMFSVDQHSQGLTLSPGVSSGNMTIENEGDFSDGVRPYITLLGPATNPIIGNTTDDSRAIRLEIILTGGQQLDIDVDLRTLMIGATNRFDAVRYDNQWWVILPGTNTITYNRDSGNAGANSTLTVKWRDAWA